MKVLCIMCGLRQLAGAGTNWKFLLSPRPIKLRVNLAPLIIAVGASPLKKNLANGEKYIEQLWQIHITTLINIALLIITAGASPLKKNSSSKLFAQLGGLGIITSSRLLLFSSYCKKTREESCQGRGKNIMQTFLSHAMHIQLFRLQKKRTSNHFPSNFLLSSS